MKYRVIAVAENKANIQLFLKDFIKGNYFSFLQELRCQHSKQKTPCPGIKMVWEGVLESDDVLMGLKIALNKTKPIALANKSEIDNDPKSKEIIRNFLKGIQNHRESTEEIKALARSIQLSLALSRSACLIS